jgi:hypothetical protein
MSRVTRSRKIDIAEDFSAVNAEPTLEDAIPTESALNDISNSPSINNMASEESSLASAVPSHIKQLKAAYRNAIGTKKNKKSKDKKKEAEDMQHVDFVGNEHMGGNDENNLRSDRPNFNLPGFIQDTGLTSLLDSLTTEDSTSPNVVNEVEQLPVNQINHRVTRRQAARQQAGQFNISVFSHSPDMSIPYVHQERTSPIAMLYLDESTAFTPSNGVYYACGNKTYLPISTDIYPSLAEAEETKENTIPEVEILPLVEEDNQTGEAADEQAANIIQTPVRELVHSTERSTLKSQDQIDEYNSETNHMSPMCSNDHSFLDQIVISPSKSVSGTEDSLEALDKMEEAMDAVAQAAQAALAEINVSPKEAHNTLPMEAVDTEVLFDEHQISHEPSPPAVRPKSPPKQTAIKSGFASVRVKPSASKQSPGLRKSASMTFRSSAAEKKPPEEPKRNHNQSTRTLNKRPMSLLPPKETTKSTKPPTRPTFELPGDAVARRLKEQREARLAQRQSSEEIVSSSVLVSGPKPIKSTKAPTKSYFELPGEAISRKNKEARDARIKAQEEEERKRREFKAKPIRKSIIPDYVPRETAASRARQSRIGLENMDGNNELTVSKRGTAIGAHRPSIQQLSLANSSAPRSPGPKPTRKPSTTSGPSMSGLATQRNVSDKDAYLQRQKAREIYNRDAKLAEEMGREKQEREAAAKRAREAASERGRQASREWAEKKKVRKLAEGDKGLSAGYGPGGQMGLK